MTKKHTRNTEDTWDVEQFNPQGWEVVNTETTRKDAKRSIGEYRQNQPGAYRLKYHRVKIAS